MSKSSLPLQPLERVVTLAGDVHGRFLLNVISNMAYMALSMGVMLWYIPFLINHLGVAAYGMVPLANSLVMYVSIGTEGFNIAVNRFLTIDLHRADVDAANRTFNTAFFISIFIALALLPLIALITWQFPAIFEVPAGAENDVRVLFGAVMLTFFASIIGSGFEVSSLAMHRFDLRNLVRGSALAIRVLAIVLFFQLADARLWQVGVSFALGAFVTLYGAWLLWRRLTPSFHIRFASFDHTRLRELWGLSGWSILNRVGMLLFLGMDIVLINFFLGARVTGEYGTLILFPELMRNLVDTVSSVLNPALVNRYALNDVAGLRALSIRSVKLLGLGLGLPIGLLCGVAQPFLSLWLGPDFQRLSPLLILMVGHLSITLATLPLTYVLTSYNKVKIQGIVTLVLGILNLLLGLLFVVWFQWGALGIALATACVFTFKNLFFLSSYSAYVMKLPWWTFYRPLLSGLIGTITVGLAVYGLSQWLSITTWVDLLIVAAVTTLLYLFLLSTIGLNQEDRRVLVNICPPPVQRYLNRMAL